MSAPTPTPTLTLAGLTVTYPGGVEAVCGVELVVAAGECLALVGESGCGKSSIALAILGLLPPETDVSGSVRLDGEELLGAPATRLRALRGIQVGLVAQNPYASCNPVHSVGRHVAEAFRAHGHPAAPGQVTALLERYGVNDAERRARQRPHQWSGGMLQRASIAAATAHDPPLLIADEPTSALDHDLADDILRTLTAGRERAVLLISHDLDQVAAHADRVAVCHAGRVVECGPVADVLDAPRREYTRLLIASTLT